MGGRGGGGGGGGVGVVPSVSLPPCRTVEDQQDHKSVLYDTQYIT